MWLLAIAALPKTLYQMLFQKKYRGNLSKRFGCEFPSIEKGDRPLVWIHAVSLGETRAIATFAKLLKAQLKNPIFVISSASETGHAEAQRSLAFADYHVYLPLDFSWIVKPIIGRVKPNLVVLTESDFWYNFLRISKENGARIILANGKISERSTNRLKKATFFAKRVFGLFDTMCLQSHLYKNRFEQVGADPGKMVVTGNLKFDDDYPALSAQELADWRKLLGITSDHKVLVMGSTHDPEEKLFLSMLQEVWKSDPKLKAILVPRHPERFQEVARILVERNIPFVRFSEIETKKGNELLILFDVMGLLRKSYQIADVAIVAGSYTSKVGGHNVLEPSWYGVPVIYGPFMHSQPDLVDLTKEYGTALQVEGENLAETVRQLLHSQDKREGYRHNAERLLRDCRGATQRTWEALQRVID